MTTKTAPIPYDGLGARSILYQDSGNEWGPTTVREVFQENVYRFRPDMLEESPVVVDVGANLGCFAILAAWHGATVYAYEPEPENFEFLRQNVRRNDVHGRVSCRNQAVWSERGKIHLVCGENASRITETGWPIRVPDPPPPIEVEAITLADVLSVSGDVGFLKMDCEAAEYAIFEAAPEEVIARFVHIAIEFHGVRVGTQEERYGGLMTKLARTHETVAIGHPYRGGYIWARRYR